MRTEKLRSRNVYGRTSQDNMGDIELVALNPGVSAGDESGDFVSRDEVEAKFSLLDEPIESSWRMLAQTLPSTLLAGLGMVAAGLVLNLVQHWEVFQHVTELFILLPALLGLKGNLEMTLAARLSTQANLGNMSTRADVRRLCLANLALVQVQSGVVGVLGSCLAVALSAISKNEITPPHVLILFCAAAVTSFLTALFLGSMTCVLVTACHYFCINPDNVAAPLAASIGDVTTLAVLAASARFIYTLNNAHGPGLLITIIVFTLLPIPGCLWMAWRSASTKDVLRTGWTPVLLSMAISSFGGFVLDKAVAVYTNMSILTPLVNGVGGNLVAVHASRMATFLHRQTAATQPPAAVADDQQQVDILQLEPRLPWLLPSAVEKYRVLSWQSVKVLVCLLLPAHLVFFTVIGLIKSNMQHESAIPVPFFGLVFSSSLLQVLVLLAISHWLVRFQWQRGRDPDSCTIPYLTAVGDLLGTGLLAIAFLVFSRLGGFVSKADSTMTVSSPTATP